ncbi:MAG: OB-fold nucleic acid binding domain-containing protein, partial [Bacteroidota bacterium]
MPTIQDLAQHEGQTVTLQGWLYNKRGSKGLFFLILRDGSGLCQCVVNAEAVDEESFAAASEA